MRTAEIRKTRKQQDYSKVQNPGRSEMEERMHNQRN